jgi:hypothetical protein
VSALMDDGRPVMRKSLDNNLKSIYEEIEVRKESGQQIRSYQFADEDLKFPSPYMVE